MRHKIGRTRRLVYAFSKRIENHRAAVALNMAWYNLGTIVRTLRITPAMACGVADHVFTLDEFFDAIVTETAPVEKPQKKPLKHQAPPPETIARPLPEGRGFLRLLPGGAPHGPGIAPAPGPRPVAPAAPAPVLREAPRTWEQLDLFGAHPAEGKDENQPE